MNTFFSGLNTVEEIKKQYKKLMLKNHPDVGGDVKVAQEINSGLKEAMKNVMTGIKSSPETKVDFSEEMFSEILAKIINFDLEIEIIGHWIYAFNSYKHKEQLKELGFWFSGKHKAWVYSGSEKRKIRTKFTTDDNRVRLGSHKVATKPIRAIN